MDRSKLREPLILDNLKSALVGTGYCFRALPGPALAGRQESNQLLSWTKGLSVSPC